MEHLRIWLQILTLIVGTGVLFDTLQFRRKYGYPFLRPLWWCYLFLNLGFLTEVISTYLLVNLFADAFSFKNSVYWEISDPFAAILFVALVFWLVRLNQSFLGKKPKKYQTGLCLGFIAFFLMGGLVDFLVGDNLPIWRVINFFQISILLLLFILVYTVLIQIVYAGRRLSDKPQRGALTTLGLFYLGGCTLVVLSAMLAGPNHGLIRASICLVFNVFPLFWYRRFLPRYVNALTSAAKDLGSLYEKHGVSEREREIIKLMLEGKSNREIAGELFIAQHTVKNHIYHIYQKLGVKSRFELVNLILRNGNR